MSYYYYYYTVVCYNIVKVPAKHKTDRYPPPPIQKQHVRNIMSSVLLQYNKLW